jgi:hypothetical protein
LVFEKAYTIIVFRKHKTKHDLVTISIFVHIFSFLILRKNEEIIRPAMHTLAGYPAGYPVSGLTGYPADQFCIRPDTGYQKRPDYPAGRISGASLYESLFSNSVAKGQKFRPQNIKGAEKNCMGPGKSSAELLAELSKKGRKGAELYSSLVLH